VPAQTVPVGGIISHALLISLCDVDPPTRRRFERSLGRRRGSSRRQTSVELLGCASSLALVIAVRCVATVPANTGSANDDANR
jgi:hypothetical protein